MKALTHSGIFHADDVLGGAILRLVCPTVEITRSRDAENVKYDIIFDVGRKFDGEVFFDHHQKDFKECRENGIPYASAGLLWRKFGKKVVNSVGSEINMEFTFQQTEAIASGVDRQIIAPVDAADSGVSLAEYAGETQHYTISNLISSMNPTWFEESNHNVLFEEAVTLSVTLLKRVILGVVGQIMAYDTVKKAIQEAEVPEIIVLDTFCPWQKVVCEESFALFIVFPDVSGKWRVQCVPDKPGSFSNRKSLPAKWAGKSNEEFDTVTGVKGGIFCHPGRFICGHKTKEGALALAHLALKE